MNVFSVPERVNHQSGEIRAGHDKVQIMGEVVAAGGAKRFEMIDLKTDRGSSFKNATGKLVECDVQPYAFAGEQGGVIAGLSLVKGAEIKLLKDDGSPGGTLASETPASRKAG